jgi:RNA polymerase-associated protein RTF1
VFKIFIYLYLFNYVCSYDENLMGDEEDRARLAAMSEKEREQEIFKRIERRDLMKTR